MQLIEIGLHLLDQGYAWHCIIRHITQILVGRREAIDTEPTEKNESHHHQQGNQLKPARNVHNRILHKETP
ncbi:hypothetical protein LMCDFJHI_00151 [Aeromonas salmonicida]